MGISKICVGGKEMSLEELYSYFKINKKDTNDKQTADFAKAFIGLCSDNKIEYIKVTCNDSDIPIGKTNSILTNSEFYTIQNDNKYFYDVGVNKYKINIIAKDAMGKALRSSKSIPDLFDSFAKLVNCYFTQHKIFIRHNDGTCSQISPFFNARDKNEIEELSSDSDDDSNKNKKSDLLHGLFCNGGPLCKICHSENGLPNNESVNNKF